MEYSHLEKIGTYDHALRTLDLQPGHCVVDVGCGAGGFVRWLAARSVNPIGVECGEAMLAEARRLDSGDVREGVGQDLPVEDNSADAVVFLASLHHIPADDMMASLQEAKRVLRDGGKIYVSEPMAEGPSFTVGRLVDDETHVRAQAQSALTQCGDADLEIAEQGQYLDEYVYTDFDTLGRIMVGIDPDRAAKFEQVKDAVAEAFHANGRRTDHGYAFEQPKKYHVLTPVDRPAATDVSTPN